MKTLTTFILGMLLFLLGTATFSFHKNFENFWDYVYVILGLFIAAAGIRKINKSTN